MTTCESIQAWVLDDTLARPEGFDAHLAACEACRRFEAGHRAAVGLKGEVLTVPRRRSPARVQRRASVLALVLVGAGVLGAGLGAGRSERSDAEASRGPTASPLEGSAVVLPESAPDADADADAELLALASLHAAVTADARRELREDATLLRAFGELPRWTAPHRTQPIRSLGLSASSVVFTSEDSP